MHQSQQNFIKSNNNIKKTYSRKQLTQWISKATQSLPKSISSYYSNVNELKNGLFFLLILQKVFPQQATFIKSKIKEKPVTEYDFDKNLQLVKKTLNKYNLQMNLDTNQIIKSKNCFQFLNWIKNLNDDLIVKNPDQMFRNQSQKILSPQKKFILNSGYKTNRDSSSSKSGQKRLSQAKSNRNYSSSKTQNPFYKIKSGKNLVQVNNKQLPQLDNNRSHVVTINKMKKSAYMSQFDSLDDCNQALYELALQDTIASFKNILKKVKNQINQPEENLQKFLDSINNAIFLKQ